MIKLVTVTGSYYIRVSVSRKIIDILTFVNKTTFYLSEGLEDKSPINYRGSECFLYIPCYCFGRYCFISSTGHIGLVNSPPPSNEQIIRSISASYLCDDNKKIPLANFIRRLMTNAIEYD